MALIKPYIGIYECEFSRKVFPVTRQSSSISFGLSSTDGGSQDNVQGPNSVDEDMSKMFLSTTGPLPIHPRCYEILKARVAGEDLSQAPNRGEEHGSCGAEHLDKDT